MSSKVALHRFFKQLVYELCGLTNEEICTIEEESVCEYSRMAPGRRKPGYAAERTQSTT
ncbi:MAG: hypothetical protein KAU10_09750 [Dehalococcoidia bacterium]|nr:hypothetical protein [Dehalococcoidia bacterium]